MITYNGMKAEEKNGNRQLPPGAYVVQVIDVRITGNAPDQRLEFMFDICEGDYKGFWMNKYNAQKERGSNYKITFKGRLSLRIPNDDNKRSQYPESDKRNFNDMIAKFLNSNPGATFNSERGLDENALKTLFIGVSVVEDEYNGNKFTKPVRFENVDDVRNGTVTPPQPRGSEPDPTTAPTVDQGSQMQIVTEELPWREDDKPY